MLSKRKASNHPRRGIKNAPWAGSAKLTWKLVNDIRARTNFSAQERDELAEAWGLHPRTVYRAYIGETWKCAKTKRLPEEYKRCEVCSVLYPRSRPSGVRRTPDHWKQKRTCAKPCAEKLKWREGAYINRGK